MGFNIVFQSRPTPRSPDALSENAAALGKQKEENKNGKDKRPSSPPLPSDPRIIPLRRQASIQDSDETASSSHAQTTSVSPIEDPFAQVEQTHYREKLCIKAGEFWGEDRSQVIIWSMRDIDQNMEAMCERVTDLVFLHLI